MAIIGLSINLPLETAMARSKLVTPLVLHAIKYFDAAARNCSFTRAAEELHVTQGAISQQIKGLEEQIGVKLFNRLPKGLVLTTEGERLYGLVTRLLQDLEDELQSIQPHASARPLVIRSSPSFSMMWLMPRLSGFSEHNRDIEIRLRGELFGMTAARMAAEEVDALILYGYRPSVADLHVVPLMDEYLMPVATPECLSRHKELSTVADVASCTLLHDDSPWEGAPSYAEWIEWMQEASGDRSEELAQSARHGHQFNLSQLAINAALLGQGVAMSRVSLVTEELGRGQLVPAFARAVRASAQYFLVLNPNAVNQRAIALFRDWIVDECERFVIRRSALLAGLCDGA